MLLVMIVSVTIASDTHFSLKIVDLFLIIICFIFRVAMPFCELDIFVFVVVSMSLLKPCHFLNGIHIEMDSEVAPFFFILVLGPFYD